MDQYNGCPVLKFQVVNEVCVLPKFVCVNLTYFTEQISLSHDNLSSHFSMLSFITSLSHIARFPDVQQRRQ